MICEKRFLNVSTLSWGFMLLFTAFQTMSNIEKVILDSVALDDSSFTGDGYVSLGIIYTTFATCNWLTPSFISVTGPRVSILTGACCYVFFIASFLYPNTGFLYTASVILGIGAALVWTGHGQYLTDNSDSETMSRNAGMFWAIFEMSLFVGNLFVYYMFTGPTIEASKRNLVFWVLTGLAVAGTAVLAGMGKSPPKLALGEAEGVSSADKELQIPEPVKEKPLPAAWHAFRKALSLLLTSKMLMLVMTFLYTGLVLTFFSSVYSSSVGFTKNISKDPQSLVGLSGICTGVGEVVGGALFGILAAKTIWCKGMPVVVTGFLVHVVAFISIFLNLPNNALFESTDDIGFIQPSATLAMIGAVCLGFGDACFNTQIYSLLGILYSDDSASAFALFKFCQSIAAAVSFYYSNHVGLHPQLGILLCMLILGTVTFCLVERRGKKSNIEEPINVDPIVNVTFVEE
ncbi:UNC93-like protein MFSD11 [Orussus abietinus]|uniref:UNC93-like protein MFSD11 n=1 Tax=Orussus abietinus TaxID=222816 RepID=UPI0006256ED5|nr:UNC93-like protein MFSD11 [Orussus abietinus]XP_012271756.1 UNC93-like protein MFSD11 [Orussus abietinus]